jgi:hypothetical protein
VLIKTQHMDVQRELGGVVEGENAVKRQDK